MLINEKVMSRSGKRMIQGNNVILREIENIQRYEDRFRRARNGSMFRISSPQPMSSPLINQFNQAKPKNEFNGKFTDFRGKFKLSVSILFS